VTDANKIIEEVLALDAKATKGPWNGTRYMFAHSIDGELTAHYRTSAPRLARALRVAMQSLNKFKDGHNAESYIEAIETEIAAILNEDT
jgi:hypothetical protein